MDNKSYIKCGPIPKVRDWRKLPTSKLTRAEKSMAFAEKFLRIPEGAQVGKPFKLYEFQEEFFYALLDNPYGTRKAIWSAARKNGKSALIAALLICYICGPEAKRLQNTQIVSGAMSREQASLIFKLAVKMIQMTPELQGLVKIIPSAKTIIGLARNIEFKSLASDGATSMGISPAIIFVDEAGQITGPTSDYVSALETSQGAHDEPVIVYLSTQAPTDNDLLSREIDKAELSKDPHTVCFVYAAPDDCELSDKKAWAMANPALGLFRSEKDLAEQLKEAEFMPSKANAARNLLLNCRIAADAPIFSKDVWMQNSAKPESLKGKKVFGGLDLSAVSDLTGLVLVSHEGDVECFAWLPEKGLIQKSKTDRVPYDVWAKSGILKTTPGASIEYEWVAHELKRIFSEYDIEQINFDRYNMKFLRPWLEKAGFTQKELEKFMEMGQGFVSLSPAIRELETKLLQAKLKHGNNPVLNMCIGNSVADIDAAGNRKFTKKKSTGRIDLAVCLAMAVDALARYEENAVKEYTVFFV